MLGSAFAQCGGRFGFEIMAPGSDVLDVRDVAAVNRWASWIEGGLIVHCAASANVEWCARAPGAAREVIVGGTEHVAQLAKDASAGLVFPQSFLIYSGWIDPIPESEPPRPLSVYGQLKAEAEQRALSLIPDALVLRMGGFFGGAARDKNFVGKIIPAMRQAIDEGRSRFEVGTRVWQPTWTYDLAMNTLYLISRGLTGTFQMASQGSATFAQIAEEIAWALGWQDRLEIMPVDAALLAENELARRPDRAEMSCSRLSTLGLNLQRPWRSALLAYLQDPFFDQYRLEVPRESLACPAR